MRLIQMPIISALCIFPPSITCAQALAPHTITVTGTSTIRVPPDNAVITVNLISTGQTSRAAVEADKGVLAHLVDAVRPFNVTTSDMRTSNINVAQARSLPRLPTQDPTPVGGYQVTYRMTVNVEDLSKITAVTDAIMQVAGNASISVQFNLKNRAAIEDKAKIEAIANARHQADILAAAEGFKIDTVIASSTTLTAGNSVPNFGILVGLQPQDGQIPITQEVVVQYGLQ
jgi:uncharacterized protein YggE